MKTPEPSCERVEQKHGERPSEALILGEPLHGDLLEIRGISEYLSRAAKVSGKGIFFVHEDGSESLLTYADLLQKALARAAGLRGLGVGPKQPIILQCLENREFVVSFWALVLIGAIPVPLAFAPWVRDAGADLVQRLERVWLSLEKPPILYDQFPQRSGDVENECIVAREAKLFECSNLDDSTAALELEQTYCPSADDVAMIQYSSGSTGAPKGVVLTHHNLASNVQAISRGLEISSNDSVASWMPYHHDMGLIGFHLVIVANGIDLVNLSPMRFIRNPFTWIEAMSRHRTTISGGPNFGYHLVVQRLTDEQIAAVDLSSLRVLLNGAEPISARVLQEFVQRMKAAGLRDHTMFPVYGMAEASLAVTFPKLGQEPRVLPVSRKQLASRVRIGGTQEPPAEIDAVHLVSVGVPVRGCQLRVVDDAGSVVDEGVVGRIQIQGANVTSGYRGDATLSEGLFEGGWLNTGDLGLVLNGELYVTGRQKDVIFVNGCNYYSFDIEQSVEDVEGLSLQQLAVAATFDETAGRDIVVMFVTGKSVRGRRGAEVLRKLWSRVTERTGVVLDYLVVVKRIPKTTSGKIQRQRLIREFLDGEHRENCVTREELLSLATESLPPLVSPTNELEERLRACWASVLACDTARIGMDDSFRSLGGTSVKAVQLLGTMEQRLGLALSHDILLKCSTLREMCSYIADSKRVCPSGEAPTALAVPISQTRTDASAVRPDDAPIAIVGIGTRLPSGESALDFWDTLARGAILIGEPGHERGFDVQRRGPIPFRAGYLRGPYEFDSDFFDLDASEAISMDPQQRIVLEVAWDVLDRAGYAGSKCSGKAIGFFLGASHNNYAEFSIYELARQQLEGFTSIRELSEAQRAEFEREWLRAFGGSRVGPHSAVNNLLNMIAARVSHTLNLKGPSLVIDTACSSSLVATHLACESLRRGECEMALCGGVNLLLTPTPFHLFSLAGVLAPSGQCKVFDESAEGMVPGEGAVLFLLKRLDDAVRDGDQVHAIIRGSAVNNDGEALSVMAPNPDQQRWVIESVYRKTGIDPRTVGYIEAHGTGTRIGDPSEVRALSSAFEHFTSEKEFCAIGSAKANVGHLLSAAGALGLAKAALVLKAREIPPCAALDKENPLIRFAESPFYAPLERREWRGESPRRAAVNSFGFGGTNCHMLLEEASEPVALAPSEAIEFEGSVLRVSGHSDSALRARCEGLADWLERFPAVSARDLCFTMNTRCLRLARQRTIAFETRQDLIERLRSLPKSTARAERGDGSVALLFTGQGSQYPGMARGLYRSVPRFRAHFDEAANYLNSVLSEPLQDLVFGEHASAERLSETLVTQSAVFCVDYAIGRILLDLGLRPTCMLGHSVGEYAAACLAGVMSLADCTTVLAARARGMQDLPANGGMCAALTTRERVESLMVGLESELGIAACNGTHFVVSGLLVALAEFQERAEKVGIVTRRLPVSHAFHSPLMAPMTADFRKVLTQVEFRAPEIPIISNVTGELMTAAPDVEYWVSHVLATVNFEQSIRCAAALGASTFVEAGPDAVLTNLVRGILGAPAIAGATSVLRRKSANWDSLSNALDMIDDAGVQLNFGALEDARFRKLVELPPYPYRRHTYSPVSHAGLPAELLHRWIWRELPESPASELPCGPILCLTERQCDVLALQRQLDATRNRVVGVVPWKGPNSGEWANHRLEVASFGALRALMAAVEAEHGRRPVAIVNCLNCAIPELGISSSSDDWSRILEERVLSVLAVAHGLEQERQDGRECRHVIVTSGGARVTDDEDVEPFAAAAFTAAMSLGHEQSRLVHSCLDLADAELGFSEDVARQIVGAMRWSPKASPVAAYRLGKLLSRQLGAMERSTEAALELGVGDTVLITGGCGGVGAELALDLARRYQVRLILTGTRPLTAHADGKHRQATESARPRQQLLRDLEGLGSEAHYFAVDVTNLRAMTALVEDVNARFGPITGVVHAAGRVDETSPLLTQKSAESSMDVIGPKAIGALVLDQVTAGQPLKFFALFSSIAASTGQWSVGLADYAAANGFLAGYAAQRSKANRPGRTVAFNWSLWEACGMGRIEGLDALVRSHGATPLKVDAALACFRSCVASPSFGAVIHVIDLASRAETLALPDVHAPSKAQADHGRGKSNGARAPGSVLSARGPKLGTADVCSRVLQSIAEVLACPRDAIDINAGFRELGLESNQALALSGRLSAELGEHLSPTLLFEYRSPKALLDFLEKKFGESVSFEREERRLATSVESSDDRIAIIGMACRFPGAGDLDGYWKVLCQGTTQIRELDDPEFLDDYFSTDEADAHGSYCKWSAAIEGAMHFDAAFFGISPREAESMDPQQRKFLEVSYEAMQQAGYATWHPRDIGVFVGCEVNHYSERFVSYQRFEVLRRRLLRESWFVRLPESDKRRALEVLVRTLKPSRPESDVVAGAGLNEIAARVSHFLDLNGPSCAVNSACSSSLVALHLACSSIRRGESTMAIVGGAYLNLGTTPFVFLSRLKALSASGECRPFDAAANGLVLGEGVAALVLKSESRAIADGDPIWAVIRGSAINNDGHSQGITVPSPKGQAAAVAAAYRNARIDPRSVSYVECHGTGTALGDPIEIEGLSRAFGTFTSDKGFCAVGSAKAVVGHMLAASGMAGVIKVALSLHHGRIPGSAHLQAPNPHIDFAETPFRVLGAGETPWQSGEGTRRAGVNAFGFGGTNAHVIMEEARIAPAASVPELLWPVVLSARSEAAARSAARRLLDDLRARNERGLVDLAKSISRWQGNHRYRWGCVPSSVENLLDSLEAAAQGKWTKTPPRTPALVLALGAAPDWVQTLGIELRERWAICDAVFRDIEQSAGTDVMNHRTLLTLGCWVALGRLLQHMELEPTMIVAEPIGVAAALVLTGQLGLGELLDTSVRRGPSTPEASPLTWACGIRALGQVGGDPVVNWSRVESALPRVEAGLPNTPSKLRLTLGEFATDSAPAAGAPGQFAGDVSLCSSKRSSLSELLEGLVALWKLGLPLNIAQLYPREAQTITLPPYPFEGRLHEAPIVSVADLNDFGEAPARIAETATAVAASTRSSGQERRSHREALVQLTELQRRDTALKLTRSLEQLGPAQLEQF